MADKGKNKFAEAASAAYKGKATPETSDPPPKRARQVEEIVALPPPPAHPTIEEQTVTQLEPSSKGTPLISLDQIGQQHEEARIEALCPQGIQHLALALTQVNSLLEEPQFSILIAKNSLWPGDRHRLNAVETNDLYNNGIHSAMGSALYVYLAKDQKKALRREFKA